MQLKEFVSETLKQIANGVKEAQQSTTASGAVIAPYGKNRERVDFDVAVTNTEGAEASAKGGIFVLPFGAGAGGKLESSTSTFHRIKFSVFVELPKGSEQPPSKNDEALKEIDEARRAAAAAIPDEFFLNTPKLPEKK